jgi:hypothetical protein
LLIYSKIVFIVLFVDWSNWLQPKIFVTHSTKLLLDGYPKSSIVFIFNFIISRLLFFMFILISFFCLNAFDSFISFLFVSYFSAVGYLVSFNLNLTNSCCLIFKLFVFFVMIFLNYWNWTCRRCVWNLALPSFRWNITIKI